MVKNAERKINLFFKKKGININPSYPFQNTTNSLLYHHLYKWWVVGLHYLKSTLEKFCCCFFPLHLAPFFSSSFFLDFLCMGVGEGCGWQFFFCHLLDTQNTYNKRRWNSMLLVWRKQVSDSLKKVHFRKSNCMK